MLRMKYFFLAFVNNLHFCW